MSWTIRTLKKHFEQRFELEKDARKLSRKLMDKRLDGMNEIREQLDRQVETFVNKAELQLVTQKIEGLSKLVYIGFGVFIVLQVLLVFILKLNF